MKKIIFLLGSLLILSFANLANAQNVVSGKITMKFDLSHYPSNEEVKLWFPYPVSTKYQNITDIKISGNFSEGAVYTEKKFGNPIFFAKWNKGTKERKLIFSFKAKRVEVRHKNIPNKELPWNKNDYRLYLTPSKLGPINDDVKKIVAKIIKNKKTITEKAKAIYDWVCENTYRKPKTRGCGKGDICKLLKDPGGKCADLSSIFVTFARAAGIPAREVFGIRLGKKNNQNITTWYHCWAQFFLPGYGWVNVDPADVRKKMLVEKLKLSDEKTKFYRKYFWGGIDAYRISLSIGKDLILNPPQTGAPINYLMYPFAQVRIKTIDWLDPKNFKYSIIWNQ